MPTDGGDLDLRGRRVLVAEDVPALRFCILELLAVTRAECLEVGDGTRLAAALATMRVDLVVTDMRMPGRNGVDVLRDRRALGDTTPFIVVSGSAPQKVSLLGLEPAMMLPKPFTREELLAAVRALVPGRGAGGDPP